MTTISKLMLWAFTIIILAGFLARGFTRQEKYECRKWEKQASEYPNYYLTSWQDEQCRAHGIKINAPIK